MSSEYNNSATNGSSCSYNSLGAYYAGAQWTPMPSNAKVVTGHYVVPAYNAPSYDTLGHGLAPTCGGYFNIQTAYGKGASQCNQAYVTSMCSGGNNGTGMQGRY